MTAFSTFTSGSSCTTAELRGPRPAPLLIQKASSHAIKKSAPNRKPVVIHMVSPKVIHVDPSEFMALVQQLTGAAAAAAAGSSSNSSSPPAATPTLITVDETTSGSGRLPSRATTSPAAAEGIRAPLRRVPPISFQNHAQEETTTRATGQ